MEFYFVLVVFVYKLQSLSILDPSDLVLIFELLDNTLKGVSLMDTYGWDLYNLRRTFLGNYVRDILSQSGIDTFCVVFLVTMFFFFFFLMWMHIGRSFWGW